MATGTITLMACNSKTGALKLGRPTQAAVDTPLKSMGAPMPSTLVNTA